MGKSEQTQSQTTEWLVEDVKQKQKQKGLATTMPPRRNGNQPLAYLRP